MKSLQGNSDKFKKPGELEKVKFFLFLSDDGWAGCDYTRGCNLQMYALEAQNREDAEEEVYQEWLEQTDSMSFIWLIDASAVTFINQDSLRERDRKEIAEEEAEMQRLAEIEKEQQEFAEYLRLKEKFEGK